MAQELVAEASTFSGALDEPGNVRDDEAAIGIGANDAEIGRERRERVIGDLGPCGGHGADERALASVGHPEEPDVRQHAELEMHAPFLALFAGSELSRRAIRARLE